MRQSHTEGYRGRKTGTHRRTLALALKVYGVEWQQAGGGRKADLKQWTCPLTESGPFQVALTV